MENIKDKEGRPAETDPNAEKERVGPESHKVSVSSGANRERPDADGSVSARRSPASESGLKGSFGHVYANEKARTKIYAENPIYPAGSIIVRERYLSHDRLRPDTVIAMVKREKGFSPETDDWEFLVFDGSTLGVQSRETVGSCATCHVRAQTTDWVFRSYLKSER